jgi:6-phosphogluconolactonase/glucosamine-6-phosphate isomerase/deaminase
MRPSDFFGDENVPRKAITMGVGSIMKAAKVYMMAWGEGKAAVIHKAVEGPITDQIPSSFLQKHRDCTDCSGRCRRISINTVEDTMDTRQRGVE